MPGAADSLTALAPAKVNIGLRIEGLREDGFHNIRTLFQAVDLEDRLSAVALPGDALTLEVRGNPALSSGPDNLVLRAAHLLRQATGATRGARLELEKNIPAGAGLGGGSSDAAATLVLLNRLWKTGLDEQELLRLALSLGSDVPFFIRGGTALGEGRGELLTPKSFPGDWGICLALTTLAVSTAEAYKAANKILTQPLQQFNMLLSAILTENLASASNHLVNDLEPGVFTLDPRLSALRGLLQRRAAAVGLAPFALSMSGSGSAFFMLFGSATEAERFSNFSDSTAGPEGLNLQNDLPVRLRAVKPLARGVQILPPQS